MISTMIGTKEIMPVTGIVKPNRLKEGEDKEGGGYGTFAEALNREYTRKKEETEETEKKQSDMSLRRLDGFSQYDRRANAFIFYLSNETDFTA